jgi:hypothetical protein
MEANDGDGLEVTTLLNDYAMASSMFLLGASIASVFFDKFGFTFGRLLLPPPVAIEAFG